MKALFVCAAGMNRSQALSIKAKQLFGWDSVPAGVWANPSVFPVLSTWADRIVLVERWWPEHFIPQENLHKVAWLEMGMDVWGNAGHPDMHELAGKLLLFWEVCGFKPGVVVYPTGSAEEIKDFRPR
jgi:hypothetical protein